MFLVATMGIGLQLFQNCSGKFNALQFSSVEAKCVKPLSSKPAEVSVKPPLIGDNYLIGDLLYDRKSYDLAANENSTGTHQAVKTTDPVLWPDNSIPIFFSFDPQLNLTPAEIEASRKALYDICDLWSENASLTCLKDLPSGSESQYAHILRVHVNKDISQDCGPYALACAQYPSPSLLVRNAYIKQNIAVSSLIAHEFGHSLGFVHEHQRDDLDEYYDYSAMNQNDPNFAALAPFRFSNSNGNIFVSDFAYDPESVMHYSWGSLYGIGIRPRPGKEWVVFLNIVQYYSTANVDLAKTVHLTTSDVESVRKIYGARTNANLPCNMVTATGAPIIIHHHSKRTFFHKSESVTCLEMETRACTNGDLSGTANAPTCVQKCLTSAGQFVPVGTRLKLYHYDITSPYETSFYKVDSICKVTDLPSAARFYPDPSAVVEVCLFSDPASCAPLTSATGEPDPLGVRETAFRKQMTNPPPVGGFQDAIAPEVTAFTGPASTTSRTIAGLSLAATDNVAVTGYMITDSTVAPLANDARWIALAPTSYTASDSAAGPFTLSGWAKDAAGNVSAPKLLTVSFTQDTLPVCADLTQIPLGSQYQCSCTAQAASMPATIWGTWLYTSDSPICRSAVHAGVLAAGASGSVTVTKAPGCSIYEGSLKNGINSSPYAAYSSSYYFTSLGPKICQTPPADSDAPVITKFSLPESAESRLVGPVTIEATDNLAVVAYLISESAAPPTATSPGWTPTKPTEFLFGGSGSATLTAYAWVKDQAGNISQARQASTKITVPTTKSPCPP